MSSEIILAIDLGTYNSAAAVAGPDGRVVPVSSSHDGPLWEGTEQRVKPFPSVVVFNPDGSIRAVGAEAKRLAETEPRWAIWGVKRLLGKTYKEAKEHGELDRMLIPVEPDEKNGRCIFIFDDRDVQPEDVSAAILSHIKSLAEKQTGSSISSAVISVPAYFDAVAVGATVDAARRAGFESVQTVPEPVAAALAYDLNVTPRPFNFLVFDLGGGTLDVTAAQVRRINSGPAGLDCRCLKNTGDTHLGGLDMDDRLVALLSERLSLGSLDAGPKLELRRAAEAAKIQLSTATEASVDLPGHDYILSRKDLEDALRSPPRDLIRACRERVQEALKGAGWRVTDVDRLLLVGGPTAMHCIRQELTELFRKNQLVSQSIRNQNDGSATSETVDPMLAVAFGAARFAKSQVVKIQPYGYGFINVKLTRTPGEPVYETSREPYMLIPRDSTFPCEPACVIPDTPFYRRDRIFSVELIQQVPTAEQDIPGVGKRKFRFLGTLQLAFSGRGFQMEISMRLNDNGELETTITNLIGSETVTYTGVGSLRRHPVELPTFEFHADDHASGGSIVFLPEMADGVREWGTRFKEFIGVKITAGNGPDVTEAMDDLDSLLELWGEYPERDVNSIFTIGKSLLHRANELRLITDTDRHQYEDALAHARGECFEWQTGE